MDLTTDQDRLQLSLFLIRVSVFGVMLLWTIDKFINPAHASQVYEHFYFIAGLEHEVMYVLGALELMVLIAFLIGFEQTWSYGMVMIFHAVSTLASWKIYLDPFGAPNILFFTAWPMLAACITLFLMRRHDRFMTLP